MPDDQSVVSFQHGEKRADLTISILGSVRHSSETTSIGLICFLYWVSREVDGLHPICSLGGHLDGLVIPLILNQLVGSNFHSFCVVSLGKITTLPAASLFLVK